MYLGLRRQLLRRIQYSYSIRKSVSNIEDAILVVCSYAAYLTTMSTLPNVAMQASMQAFTVSRTRTSHSNPKHRSCQPCICCMVFSIVLPTAATLSPWLNAVLTSDLPICPVAPKMSQFFCVVGLFSSGGAVDAGRCSLGLFARSDLGERTTGLLAEAMRGWM